MTEKVPFMSIPDAFIASIIGFLIVFFVLIILMAMIKIMRGIIEQMEAKPVAAAAAPAAAAPAPAVNPNMVPAKRSLGDIMLHDVDDKTAALIMAIVADKMEAPLNELRFISIQEKK